MLGVTDMTTVHTYYDICVGDEEKSFRGSWEILKSEGYYEKYRKINRGYSSEFL